MSSYYDNNNDKSFNINTLNNNIINNNDNNSNGIPFNMNSDNSYKGPLTLYGK